MVIADKFYILQLCTQAWSPVQPAAEKHSNLKREIESIGPELGLICASTSNTAPKDIFPMLARQDAMPVHASGV